MHPTLQRWRDHSFTLSTLTYLVAQWQYRAGLRRHLSGATHRAWSVDAGVDYVERVFSDYLLFGRLTPEALRGKRVLEVGPGDNLGVALMFAAHGASKVVCLDRFVAERDAAKANQIYLQLKSRLQRRGHNVAVDETLPDVISVSAAAIESARDMFPPRSFDLIVSRAVLEHVYDVPAAWRAMDALLVPGGKQLHKIDFRNHSLYHTLHPLFFLRIPEWLWQMVAAPDPTLNRQRAGAYEALARRTASDYEIHVTHLALRDEELPHGAMMWPPDVTSVQRDVEQLEAYRRTLCEPFRSMSAPELLVAGIFLIATKSIQQSDRDSHEDVKTGAHG